VDDYIIVGAGSAGCVLAERLSQSAACRVRVLEAGPPDRSLLIHMPKGIGRLMGDPRFTAFYPTEPEEGNGYVGETWIRGSVLGGSSSINGMVYNRGQPADYDRLEELGCSGWNWASILPHFRAIEDHPLGPSPLRGGGGALRLSLPKPVNPLSRALLEAGQALQLAHLEDINGTHGAGAIGIMPQTISAGRRVSAAAAFLDRARSRANLSIVTGCRADRLLFENRRAAGVVCTDGREYRCRREVILAAGALESPAVLMRSGIGDGRKLDALNIPVVHHSPNVGRNLMEHRVLFMKFLVRSQALSENRQYKGWRLFGNIGRYAATRSGLMSRGSFEVGCFVRAGPHSTRPDSQILLTPYSIDTTKHPLTMESDPCITLFGFILSPDSRGSLEIRSSDPNAPPLIVTNYLTTPHDREIAVGIAKWIRRLVGTSPFKEMIVEERAPGPSYQSEEDFLRVWREGAGTGYHAIGTCAMGSSPDSVLDPSLRVRGVKALRVVDASILPHMVAGNTNAPVLAVASRAADLILEENLP
jgi:choline dehydrogenase-like flavoprotein